MFNGAKVIDVHGRRSTPAQFRAYAYNLIALRAPSGGGLQIPEKAMEEAQARRLGMMDERGIDVQFISRTTTSAISSATTPCASSPCSGADRAGRAPCIRTSAKPPSFPRRRESSRRDSAQSCPLLQETFA